MMGLVRAAPAVAAVAAVSLLAAPLVHRVVPTGGWADLTAAGACVRAVCPRRHLSSHVDATTAHSQGSSNDHIVFASQLCWPLAMNEHSLFVCRMPMHASSCPPCSRNDLSLTHACHQVLWTHSTRLKGGVALTRRPRGFRIRCEGRARCCSTPVRGMGRTHGQHLDHNRPGISRSVCACVFF
jgi:hypothetical protein